MQANIFLLVVYSLYADQYKLFKKTKKKHVVLIFLVISYLQLSLF